MKLLLSFSGLLMLTAPALAQEHLQKDLHALALSTASETVSSRTWHGLFKGDRPLTYRSRSPMLVSLPATASHQSDSYWMSTMTSQSYNSGKVGTFYYWDVQGNLRESRFFFDIAGKNKRGLKLVFRRR